MHQTRSLDPIIPKCPKILILGSMPGAESLRQQQYYAHPRNAFWYIIEQLSGIDAEAPYLERIAQLKLSNIALWDVIANCDRPGSLDSNIAADSIQLNPIKQLLNQYPTIECIGLNGGKAFELFERHFIQNNNVELAVQYVQLPSTSPAHARLNKMQKCQLWKQKLNTYIK